MATYTKYPLSASVNGQQIIVVSGSVSPSPIHTPPAGTSSLDEVWIYGYNDATQSVVANILWGSTTEPNSVTRFTIPSRSGRMLLIDGKVIQNSLAVSAYTSISASLLLEGFINRLTY